MLNVAENVTHNMHNLYTLRGAEIRDAIAWSGYIEQTRELFADKSDVMIAQHHWPKWGQANIDGMLRKHRDLYKYIHDQSVRLMNQGYTPREIAAQLKLPASLANEWSTRGYYGTLSHNTKAVYQKYLGWYDANPTNLDPLPRSRRSAMSIHRRREHASRSGADRISERQLSVGRGGANQLVLRGSVVHGGAGARRRRAGAARLPERVGRLAQVCLTAGLRGGKPKAPDHHGEPRRHPLDPAGLFFDYLGVRPTAQGRRSKQMVINWVFPTPISRCA
jgi:alkyl sulfatase BDS1-like metallo-beta-lactamase superfamily hydrolase